MRRLCLIICLALPLATTAQRLDFDALWQIVQNYVYSEFEDETDLDDLYQHVEFYYYNPINWNEATEELLSDINLLRESEIEELLFYAYEFRPVRDVKELLLVENIHPALLVILPNLLYVESEQTQYSLKDQIKKGKHLLRFATDYNSSSIETHQNLPLRLSTRYNFNASNRLKIGFSAENDAHEPWTRGFDLYNAYVSLHKIGAIESLTAGAFRVQFGCGLIAGTQRYGSAPTMLLTTSNINNKISGYNGTQESRTQYGIGTTLKFNKIRCSIVYGYSPIDCDTTGGAWHSVIQSGTHSTPTEIERRHSLGLHTVLANVNYSTIYYSIGATLYYGRFTLPAERPDNVWNAHAFTGFSQKAASVNYKAGNRSITFFGETALARSATTAVATTNNLLINIHNQLILTFNHHYISPDYHVFNAQSLTSGAHTNSEHGASLAIEIPLARTMHITAFANVFTPLYPTTQHYASPYYDASLRYDATIKEIFVQSQIRYRNRPDASGVRKQSAQLDAKIVYSLPRLTFTAGAAAGYHKQFALLLHSSAQYRLAKIPLSFDAQIAFFSADDYLARFYLYEPALTLSGRSTMLYGKGFKYSLSAAYRLQKATLALHASHIVRPEGTSNYKLYFICSVNI